MTRRDKHQAADIAAIKRALRANSRALLVRPTGYGKSRVATGVLGRRLRACVVTKLVTVVDQWSDDMSAAGLADRVEACTFGTLRRARPFDLLIVDEAHHAITASARKALAAWSGPVLAMTATPFAAGGRSDQTGPVFELFSQPVGETIETLDGIAERWLAPISAGGQANAYFSHSIPGLDLSLVYEAEHAIGAKARKAERHLQDVGAAAHMAKIYKKRAPKHSRGLVYVQSQAFALDVARELRKRRVRAEVLVSSDGKTRAEQQETIARLERGELDVIVNCMKATEGVDIPSVDVILIGRPCGSLRLLCQIVGRGLRYQNGKRLLLIDSMGAVARHPDVLTPLSGPSEPEEQLTAVDAVTRKRVPRGELLRRSGLGRRADSAELGERIRAALNIQNGKATVPRAHAADAVGCSPTAVQGWANRNGIRLLTNAEVQGGGPQRDAQIRKQCRIVNGRPTVGAKVVARRLGCDDSTVIACLRRHGIEPLTNLEAHGSNQERDKQILRLSRIVNGRPTVGAKSVAQYVGCDGKTVRACLRRHGIEPLNYREGQKARSDRK